MKEKFVSNIKQYGIAIAVCVAWFVVTLFLILGGAKSKTHKAAEMYEYSSVSSICELATLKSYYHNVVVYAKDPSIVERIASNVLVFPFGELTKFGYKQYWLEYSGIVESGIDASLVRISDPDKDGVVKVYVPDAKVLNVYADETTLTTPLTEAGLFTSVSVEEKMEAFSAAQSAMR